MDSDLTIGTRQAVPTLTVCDNCEHIEERPCAVCAHCVESKAPASSTRPEVQPPESLAITAIRASFLKTGSEGALHTAQLGIANWFVPQPVLRYDDKGRLIQLYVCRNTGNQEFRAIEMFDPDCGIPIV